MDGCSRRGVLRGTNEVGFYDPTEAIGEIHCCSMDGLTCSRKRNGSCRSGSNDAFKVTWLEAKQHCNADGMRLCNSQEEVDRCCGTGCSTDRDLVWTAVSSSVRCESWCQGHSNPWSQKCNWATGACSACSECTDDSESGSHYVACGRPGRCSQGTSASEDDVVREVRCVSDTVKNNWSNSICNSLGARLWWESDIWGSCQVLAFSDAEQFCNSLGARLPTLAEVEGGCVAGSGCGYDSKLIWTSTSAE